MSVSRWRQRWLDRSQHERVAEAHHTIAGHDDITAVVLAGGLGTRVRELHPNVPKPMIAVAGRPILHWITAWLAAHGIRHIVYSTGYRGEVIERWCSDGWFPSIVQEVAHEPSPLGTAGGLFNALPRARRTVVVVNGDSLCLGGLAELLAMGGSPVSEKRRTGIPLMLHEDYGLSGALIGIPVDDAARYGSLDIGDDGCLRAFREKQPGMCRAIVNAGMYRFDKAALAGHHRPAPSSIERDLIPGMLTAGVRLGVIVANGAPFIDFGTPEALAAADAFLGKHGQNLSGIAGISKLAARD